MKTRTILIGLGVGLCVVAAFISFSVVRAGDTVPPSTQETETTIIWDDLRGSDLVMGGEYVSVGFTAWKGAYVPVGTKVRFVCISVVGTAPAQPQPGVEYQTRKVECSVMDGKSRHIFFFLKDDSGRVPFVQVFKVKGKFVLANYNRR